jgi:parallel beta-helix repeat protein
VSGTGSFDDLEFGATLRGFAASQRLSERYTLVRTLGQGGMGVVWLARDEELGREIAMKFLPEMVIRDREAIADLKRETNRSLELTHPNIVRIHDFVQSESWAGITMEYVDGDTLSALKVEEPGGCFDVERLAPWIDKLCAALAYAHEEARVVHRDLKPSNLMLTRNERLKITDFGIACSLCESVSRLSMRPSGGTLVYMSPQQAMGEHPAVADDIYALGVTIYDLLTGKPPFFSGDVLAQVREKTPPPMAERRKQFQIAGKTAIPSQWEKTVAACLAKEPAQRPQSAAAVREMLTLVAEPPIPATVAAAPQVAAPGPVVRGRSPMTTVAILLLLVAMTAVAGYYFGVIQPREQAREAQMAKEAADADAAARAALQDKQQLLAQTQAQEAARQSQEQQADQQAQQLKAEQDKAAENAAAARLAAQPKTLTVPDDYSTIQAALNAARPGDTVKVKAGVYNEGLRFPEGIQLIGEGMGLVRVRTEATNNVLHCNGIQKGFVSGITFEQTTRSGNEDNRDAVIRLDQSSVELTDCRVQSGDGDGIFIDGGSPKISQCIMQNNGWDGIDVREAQPALISNQCSNNAENGIFLGRGSGGGADGNICDNNLWCGITVHDSGSAPVLRENQCKENRQDGIDFEQGAAGEADENICENNKWCGIAIHNSSSAPVLRENQCKENQQNGIDFDKGAGGEADGNICEGNTCQGILVDGRGTSPILRDNTLARNQRYGINGFQGGRPKVIQGNTYTDNKLGTYFVQ